MLVGAVGGAAHQVDDRDAEYYAKKLPFEVMIGVGKPGQGRDGAGAIDHYKAEGDQQGHFDPQLYLQGKGLPG